MSNKIKILSGSKNEEIVNRKKFRDMFLEEEIVPFNEFFDNLGLCISRQNMSRILYINELYKKIIDIHGVIIEFGVRWGQNLALFENFRGIYEPFNYNRKIVGFDTFEGFASIDEKDNNTDIMIKGAYDVTPNYEKHLGKILDYHENESPISHIKKYELIKGDATITAKKYFEENPYTIVSLAYFDFDIYKPTYECLLTIKDHLTKGSVVAFDELNFKEFPGETLALKEVFGLDKYGIKRVPYNPLTSYIVIE